MKGEGGASEPSQKYMVKVREYLKTPRFVRLFPTMYKG